MLKTPPKKLLEIINQYSKVYRAQNQYTKIYFISIQ